MKVIKLGGSLLRDAEALKQCLKTIEQNLPDKVVIVPGGGVFADQVRVMQKKLQFDELTAHRMAILAMKQTALLLNNLKPQFVLLNKLTDFQTAASVMIWSPDLEQLDETDIATSWDVTSDSLAAWLANQLNATELILVKSAALPEQQNIVIMQQQGLLDKAFAGFIKNARYTLTILDKHSFNEHTFI